MNSRLNVQEQRVKQPNIFNASDVTEMKKARGI